MRINNLKISFEGKEYNVSGEIELDSRYGFQFTKIYEYNGIKHDNFLIKERISHQDIIDHLHYNQNEN